MRKATKSTSATKSRRIIAVSHVISLLRAEDISLRSDLSSWSIVAGENNCYTTQVLAMSGRCLVLLLYFLDVSDFAKANKQSIHIFFHVCVIRTSIIIATFEM